MRITFSASLFIFALLPYSTISNIVIACTCSDGVLIGSDSLSVSGSLVGNRLAESVFLLGTNTVVCCASGQSDFQHLLSDLKSFIRSAKAYDGGVPNVASIARYARKLVNQKYRKAHLIIAGSDAFSGSDLDEVRDIKDSFDKKVSRNHGSDDSVIVANHPTACAETTISDIEMKGKNNRKESRYNVHEILSGGTLISQPFALAGSGSDCVLTLMEELFARDFNSESDIIEKDIVPCSSSEDFWTRNKIRSSLTKFRSMQTSVGLMKKVLKAALRADPKTGSALRVWSLDGDGLRLL
jgi:20S proteasome alpha/beta subunit